MSLTREDIERRGHPVWVEVDLEAIRHNIRTLSAASPGAQVMGVVKGYAYGHGNPQSALAMIQGGAARLGVARVAEGIHLRDAGIGVPIHVLTEPPEAAARAIVEHDLTATVYTEGFAEALSDAATAAGRDVRVHLKVDTGMHRVGIAPSDAVDVAMSLRSMKGIDLEGVWSHLAVADVKHHPFTRKQLDSFRWVLAELESAGVEIRIKHLANSAATMSDPDTHFDLVRCGIAAYGLWPSTDLLDELDLRPALELKARVTLVKTVERGEAISYGLTYAVEDESTVATVIAGYADGYDRRLSNRADVLIDGYRYRVAGTVCMDQLMVDMGSDHADIGTIATLIGGDDRDRVSAEELAVHVGTINYEVTTRIPSRVPRIFLNEQEP